jgi:predicted Fe-Mo cluster-binding NifX family protein
MKVAIPQWQGRVSPVFDVAGSLLVAEVTDGIEVGREHVVLTATDPVRRAEQVVQAGAEVLICGAVSWPLESALSAAGVVLYPQVCGAVEEVLEAFRKGRIDEAAFVMPGCCGRRRRHQARSRRGRGLGRGCRQQMDQNYRHNPGTGRIEK